MIAICTVCGCILDGRLPISSPLLRSQIIACGSRLFFGFKKASQFANVQPPPVFLSLQAHTVSVQLERNPTVVTNFHTLRTVIDIRVCLPIHLSGCTALSRTEQTPRVKQVLPVWKRHVSF